MKKTLLGFIFFLCMCSTSITQEYTISGYISDEESGEKLIGANVFDANSSKGTITNNYGFFSLTLPSEEVDFTASYIGFTSYNEKFKLDKNRKLEISLSSSIEMDVVEIVAEESKRIEEETQMSTIEVPIVQIKKIPPLLGEVDVLKALQLLPGVQSGGEGQSGLYVRGGSPDQNLILLDGVPVYNASHLFGFFSVFNADAIKDVKLIKGGFPARYGGRLSSVLEINMKEGNAKKFSGSGSIGVVSSKLTLEGPIRNENTSYIISGRRTYIDILAKPFIKSAFADDGKDGTTGYYFYDLNAKINHKLTDRDRLYLSFYRGNDQFYLEEKDNSGTIRDYSDNGLGWGNLTTAFRWNHEFTPKLFANTSITYSKYDLNTDAEFGSEFTVQNVTEKVGLDYNSGIRDFAAKIDIDFLPNPDHFVRFGANIIAHEFKPGIFNLLQEDPLNDYFFSREIGQKDISALEMAAYVEDDFVLFDKLKVNGGIHFSGFNVEGKFYNSIQPRFSSRYLLDNGIALKVSFATMRQYVQLLAFEGIGLPTDLWLPTTEKVKPQDSWQVAGGIAKTYNKTYEVSLEGYYKKMTNVIAYKDGEGLFAFSDWQDRVTQGDGRSFGFEAFVQKKRGRLSGWVGYTLSWSYRQFPDLNFGKEFPYRYDRRHDLSIVANYELKENISLSGTWIYGTGNAVTLANSQYHGSFLEEGNFRYFQGDFYNDRNNYRMRAYHRMDIGINFIKKKKTFSRTWSLGMYNAYNQKNPFFVFLDSDTTYNPDGSITTDKVLKQASLFPLIPYITYSFEF